MKFNIALLIIFCLLGTNSTSAQRAKKENKPKAPHTVWDTLGFTQKVNAIMEPSGHSESLKKTFQKVFENYVKDEVQPLQLLKVYSLSDAWTPEYDENKFAKTKWQQFAYITKNTKTGECVMNIGFLVLNFDFDSRQWESKPKIGWYEDVMNAENGFKYKKDDSYDFYTLTGYDNYLLDCATVAVSNSATSASSGNAKQSNTNTNASAYSRQNHAAATDASSSPSASSPPPAAIKDGPFEQKTSSGELMASGQYQSGKKTGKWTYYNKGTVTREEEYTNGQLNGKKTVYTPGGTKEYEETYINGKREGARTDYDKAGGVDKMQSYKDNLLDGAYKRYTNGKLMEQGTYSKGKKDGTWKNYDISGKVIKTVVFKDGIVVQ